jgi:hypothetical protein
VHSTEPKPNDPYSSLTQKKAPQSQLMLPIGAAAMTTIVHHLNRTVLHGRAAWIAVALAVALLMCSTFAAALFI